MVHTFPKGICPKVNIIVRLEFELAYYDCAVQRFNYYTMKTPPHPVIHARRGNFKIVFFDDEFHTSFFLKILSYSIIYITIKEEM